MTICSLEEADTRIVVHILHSLSNGAKSIEVKTLDTDVLVILLIKFCEFQEICNELELCVAFGVGKDYKLININAMFDSLDRSSQAMLMFHALTGCDTTSTFFRKGKKIAWKTWKSFPIVTSVFLDIFDNPFQEINSNFETFKILERYTILLYDRNCTEECVNDARRELFSKKVEVLKIFHQLKMHYFSI